MQLLRRFTFFLFVVLATGHVGAKDAAMASSLSALEPATAGPSATSLDPSFDLTSGDLAYVGGPFSFTPSGVFGFLGLSASPSGDVSGFAIGDTSGGVLLAGTFVESVVDTTANSVFVLFSNDLGTIFGGTFTDFLIMTLMDPMATLTETSTGTFFGSVVITGATSTVVPLPAGGILVLSALTGLCGLRLRSKS